MSADAHPTPITTGERAIDRPDEALDAEPGVLPGANARRRVAQVSGGSLNIASRVATAAKPHQILVTAAAHGEVRGLSGVMFTLLGKRLKGLADELELFEVRSDDPAEGERARDPVCGMEMAPTEIAARLTVDGHEVVFCREKCLRVYLERSGTG